MRKRQRRSRLKRRLKRRRVGEHFFVFLCWVPPLKIIFVTSVFLCTLSSWVGGSPWGFSMGPWDLLCSQFFGDLCLAIRLRIPTKKTSGFCWFGIRCQVVHMKPFSFKKVVEILWDSPALNWCIDFSQLYASTISDYLNCSYSWITYPSTLWWLCGIGWKTTHLYIRLYTVYKKPFLLAPIN